MDTKSQNLKIIVFVLALFCITQTASSSCINDCRIDNIYLTEQLTGQEMQITVTFTNVGTREGGCRYHATLHSVAGKELDRQPPAYDPLFYTPLGTTLPGQTKSITFASYASGIYWNACDLNGEYYVKIHAFNHEGSDCEFKSETKTFAAPKACCNKMEGLYCLDYGSYDPASKFTCDGTVQVNDKVPCLVYCITYQDECRCSLVEACAVKCSTEGASCPYDYLDCNINNHYKCGGGYIKEKVRCSETQNCKYVCAAACGKTTTCSKDCENCCKTTTCNRANPAYTPEEYSTCMEACTGLCKANEQLCTLLMIATSLAVSLCAFVLAVNGVKWLISDDSEGRTDAKRGIFYALLGLTVTLLATALSHYLFLGEVALSC